MCITLGSFDDRLREPRCKACKRIVAYVNASRRCADCQADYEDYIYEKIKESRVEK